MRRVLLKKITCFILLGFLGNQVLASEEKELRQDVLDAISSANIDKIEEYLEKGLNLNIKDKTKDELTYLQYAVLNSTSDVVLLLLKKGADPKLTSVTGRTPLHTAASDLVHIRKNRPDTSPVTIKHLIDYGANINAQDDLGQTALHDAVISSNEEKVKILLSVKGIDLNVIAKNSYGFSKVTPAHLAVFLGKAQILTLLIENNTNKTFLEDGEGHTVPTILEDLKLVHTKKLSIEDLKGYGQHSRTSLINVLKDQDTMKLLIKIYDNNFLYFKPVDD